jgi:hypothetical protein
LVACGPVIPCLKFPSIITTSTLASPRSMLVSRSFGYLKLTTRALGKIKLKRVSRTSLVEISSSTTAMVFVIVSPFLVRAFRLVTND